MRESRNEMAQSSREGFSLQKSLQLIKLKLLAFSSEIKSNPNNKKKVVKGVFYNLGKILLMIYLGRIFGERFFIYFSFPFLETNVLCDFLGHCGFHQSKKLSNFIRITKMLMIPSELNVLLFPSNWQKVRYEFLKEFNCLRLHLYKKLKTFQSKFNQ